MHGGRGALDGPPMMSGDARLSDSYAADRCCFPNWGHEFLHEFNTCARILRGGGGGGGVGGGMQSLL